MRTEPLQSFFSLSPDHVMNAIDKCGFLTTGHFQQLNSYENRVFDIRLEEAHPSLPTLNLIAKFYRPQRWSRQAIEEEHGFLSDLNKEDIPAVAPIILKNGSTIDVFNNDIFFSIFPKTLGRMPQEFLNNDLSSIGKLLARLHNTGAQKEFRHRPTMGDLSHLGWSSLNMLKKWVAPELWPRYQKASQEILAFLDSELDSDQYVRIHGDCHKGNLLFNGDHFFFVDFDDSINGPPTQDFWMLLSGDPESSDDELDQLLGGYTDLRDYDEDQLDLIPALRGLRIFSYAAWIANRWQDPSFPRLFPNFNTYVYWAEEVEALEKLAYSL